MDPLNLSDHEAESDEDGEAMTAAEVLAKLEEAWLNEKFSPYLLESKSDIVDCILEQIQQMEANIQAAKKGEFKVSIHRMEIDRIRYILSSYLRIRLSKIEKYASKLLQGEHPETAKSILSQEEEAYAKEFQANMDGHFKTVALKNMPSNLQTMDPKLSTIQPNLDGYVFFRVNESVDGVMVEEEAAGDDVIDLEVGDQHVMRYRPVAELVASGAVSLI